MKKHEPRPTRYHERHPLRLAAEYLLAAVLFVYPAHVVNDALNCNIPIRSDNSNLVRIAKAGN